MIGNMEVTALRIFTVFGPNQREDLAIRRFINAALTGGVAKIYGSGYQVRDFTYIDDTCNAIRSLIKSVKELRNHYDIGTGSSVSIMDVIKKISIYLDAPIKIKYEDEDSFDVTKTIADLDDLQYDAMWKPLVTFDEGLKRQIEWQKKHLI